MSSTFHNSCYFYRLTHVTAETKRTHRFLPRILSLSSSICIPYARPHHAAPCGSTPQQRCSCGGRTFTPQDTCSFFEGTQPHGVLSCVSSMPKLSYLLVLNSWKLGTHRSIDLTISYIIYVFVCVYVYVFFCFFFGKRCYAFPTSIDPTVLCTSSYNWWIRRAS